MRSAALTDLLFLVFPLVRTMKKDTRRAQLMLTLIEVSRETAGATLNVAPALMPREARETAAALMRQTMQVMRQNGFSAVDLNYFFNERSDAGDMILPIAEGDTAVDAVRALLALLQATGLRDRDANQLEVKSA